MLNFEIGFVKAGIAEIRLTVSNAIKLSKKISIKRKKSLTGCEKCAAKS